jgi:hypothetical protein
MKTGHIFDINIMTSHNNIITCKGCEKCYTLENLGKKKKKKKKFLAPEAITHISDIILWKKVRSHQQCKYITSNANTIQPHLGLMKHD